MVYHLDIVCIPYTVYTINCVSNNGIHIYMGKLMVIHVGSWCWLMVINVDISTVTPPGRGRSETSDGLGGNGLEGDQPQPTSVAPRGAWDEFDRVIGSEPGKIWKKAWVKAGKWWFNRIWCLKIVIEASIMVNSIGLLWNILVFQPSI
jgi:hypothetical protein